MLTKKLGQVIVVFGILGLAGSLVIDIFPGTKPGIQATQILGIEVSVFILVIGILISNLKTEKQIELKEMADKFVTYIINLPVTTWVLMGFFISYTFLFIFPVFLNSTLRIDYLNKYLPDRYPIGMDLIKILDLMHGWFQNGRSPYPAQFYSPFTYIFFAPLLLIDSYPKLFIIFTLFSITAYISLTLILPVKLGETKNLPMVLLFFITGLFSYGLQFELERGQYNIFTFLLCMLSIYIFHNHREYRILAYFFFILSVQLKLYPIIFIVMLVDDWKDWKAIAYRFLGIGLANFVLLLVMGTKVFMQFIQSVTDQVVAPTWNMDVNHSIKSFVDILARGVLNGFPLSWQFVAEKFPMAISTTLLAIFMVIFILALISTRSRQEEDIDFHLLLICTVGTLILPVSMDYKLCILATPMALFMGSLPELKNARYKFIHILLIIGISLVYSSLLVPFKYKPDFLRNSFPPLFLILLFSTVLNFVGVKNKELDTQL